LSPAHAFDLLVAIINAIFAKSTPKLLYRKHGSGLDQMVVANYIKSAIKGFYLSCENLEKLAAIVSEFLTKNKPTSKVYIYIGFLFLCMESK